MKRAIFILCILFANALHLKEAHFSSSFPTGLVNLLSDIGLYLARCNNCGSGLYPDSAGIYGTDPKSPSAIWNVELIGESVALKGDNGKYLAKCTNCWSYALVTDSAFVQD